MRMREKTPRGRLALDRIDGDRIVRKLSTEFLDYVIARRILHRTKRSGGEHVGARAARNTLRNTPRTESDRRLGSMAWPTTTGFRFGQ